MFLQKAICDLGDVITLLDLPEITFTKIFQNLDDQFVWFTVSNISRKIRSYVDNYMQLINVFRDVYIRIHIRRTIIFYIFKKFNQMHSIYCESFKYKNLCLLDCDVMTSEKAVLDMFTTIKRRNFLRCIKLFWEQKSSRRVRI